MQSTLLAMKNIRNLKAAATNCLFVVNRLWLVNRQSNWPPLCEALKIHN